MIVIVDRRFVFLMFFSLFSNYVMIETGKWFDLIKDRDPMISYDKILAAINNNNDQHTKLSKSNSTSSDTSVGAVDSDKSAEECSFLQLPCSELRFPCIKCQTQKSCKFCIWYFISTSNSSIWSLLGTYGEPMNATCEVVNDKVQCMGNTTFTRPYICRYCFLTEHWEHDCVQKSSCISHQLYRTNCTVNNDVICLGTRSFHKNIKCNFTRGVKYRTALILSIVFGGFGVDRFYLGFWQEGIGKLFSFGGLGVWVIIDTILIAIGYLGTSDESLLI